MILLVFFNHLDLLSICFSSVSEIWYMLTLIFSPKHEAFMLGTTKSVSDSKGFELFITTAPIPDLNDKLIVFGSVVKGEDVVQVAFKPSANCFSQFLYIYIYILVMQNSLCVCY